MKLCHVPAVSPSRHPSLLRASLGSAYPHPNTSPTSAAVSASSAAGMYPSAMGDTRHDTWRTEILIQVLTINMALSSSAILPRPAIRLCLVLRNLKPRPVDTSGLLAQETTSVNISRNIFYSGYRKCFLVFCIISIRFHFTSWITTRSSFPLQVLVEFWLNQSSIYETFPHPPSFAVSYVYPSLSFHSSHKMTLHASYTHYP